MQRSITNELLIADILGYDYAGGHCEGELYMFSLKPKVNKVCKDNSRGVSIVPQLYYYK